MHGYITKTKLLELNEKTDCFITHNWGLDEEGRDNHERATKIKDSLAARNLIIWFDAERMSGNIADAMAAGKLLVVRFHLNKQGEALSL